jgi:ABC-type transport system involved in multi-copper enzyme maturation permease subunit
VIRLVGVEFFKLRKRFMTWVLAALLIGLVVLMYSVLWSVSGRIETFGEQQQFSGADLRRALFLEASVPFSLQIVSSFGTVLAVILAAGAVGSEYSWGTMRLIATASPGRLRLVTAKLFVVFVIVAVGALVAVVVGLAYSSIITIIDGGADFDFVTVTWARDQMASYGRTLFVMAPYITMAFAVALIGRSTLAGVGAGIGFALVEQVVSSLMRLAASPWSDIPDWLIGSNVEVVLLENDLPEVARFGPPEEELGRDGANALGRASIILAAYSLAFTALAFLTYRRRDITAGG